MTTHPSVPHLPLKPEVIGDLARQTRQINHVNGWGHNFTPAALAAGVALIHSEVTEAFLELPGVQRAEEIIDVSIRCMDLIEQRGPGSTFELLSSKATAPETAGSDLTQLRALTSWAAEPLLRSLQHAPPCTPDSTDTFPALTLRLHLAVGTPDFAPLLSTVALHWKLTRTSGSHPKLPQDAETIHQALDDTLERYRKAPPENLQAQLSAQLTALWHTTPEQPALKQPAPEQLLHPDVHAAVPTAAEAEEVWTRLSAVLSRSLLASEREMQPHGPAGETSHTETLIRTKLDKNAGRGHRHGGRRV